MDLLRKDDHLLEEALLLLLLEGSLRFLANYLL